MEDKLKIGEETANKVIQRMQSLAGIYSTIAYATSRLESKEQVEREKVLIKLLKLINKGCTSIN